MSTPLGDDKDREAMRGKRIVRGLKWGLWAVILGFVAPVLATVIATVVMTPVLLVVVGSEKGYGGLWGFAWMISLGALYGYVAYLTGAYWLEVWRTRRNLRRRHESWL